MKIDFSFAYTYKQFWQRKSTLILLYPLYSALASPTTFVLGAWKHEVSTF